jgi:hypothetical protein
MNLGMEFVLVKEKHQEKITHTHTYYTAEDQDYDYREDEDDGYVKGYGDNNVGIRRA